MKKIFTLPKTLSLFLFTAFILSCNSDDDNITTPADNTITQIVTNTGELSILTQALIRADLSGTLDGSGPFTVFAPTNEAFEDFLEETGFSSLEDIPVPILRQVLLYHVVSGSIQSSQLETGLVTTLSNNEEEQARSIFVSIEGGVMINNRSAVTQPNLIASNGVIHIVDKVISLDSGSTIADIASGSEDFSVLVEALDRAGLVNTLATNGNFTVFAPTNSAFNTFLNVNGFSSLDDVPVDLLTQILLNHVVSGNVRSTQLITGYISTLAVSAADSESAINMYVSTVSGVMLNGVSSVISADIVAANGIIHVVDEVIDLPTVVTFALADPNFETLVAALTREDQPDFPSILSGEGPFTVFAPTNDAFSNLLNELELPGLPDIPSAILTQTLQYHVVGGANVRSSSLSDGQTVTTLQGSQFTVNLTENSTTITDTEERISNVIAVDVQANNGVIHVLDMVLLPQFN